MSAKWITVSAPVYETSLYIFKKSFALDEAPTSFNLRISADTRYKLYINGKEMTQGPCQSVEYLKYFEELDCASVLHIGENTIEAKVLHIADNNQFITMYRRNKPALYLDGTVITASGIVDVSTDESYEVLRLSGITFHNRRGIMRSVAPFEEVSANVSTLPMTAEVLYEPFANDAICNDYGVMNMYRMEKRPLPLLSKSDETELIFVREYIGDDGRYNAIFETGAYTTAMLNYDFRAEKGSTLKFIYAECALTQDENGKLVKKMRDNRDGVIDSNAYDIITATGEDQSYELFYYRAFRYVRVECDEKPEYLKLRAARYTYSYEKNANYNGIGSFESSDPLHTDIWKISCNTLECCTHETVVDCPFYEQQQYVMDGGLESLYGWKFSNDGSIQKKLLTDLAQSQNNDGLLCANYPNVTTQIIPGFSLYFVLGIREYLRYTGDEAFARRMSGVCDRILEYFGRTATESGLIMPDYGWNYLDWVKGWRCGVPNGAYESPMTAYNFLYAASLNAAAEICDACGRIGLASDYRTRSDAIIRAVNTCCYDKERGLYTDVASSKEYSQHTTVWAILSGAVAGDAAKKLMIRTMESEDVSKCSFSMRYYLLRALEASGCYEKYADSVLSGWKIMLDNHCTTWCEDAVTCRSECHAWSCTPMYEMSAMILGVQPKENGFASVRIKPHICGLAYAKGRVPIPNGWIDVEWHIDNGRLSLNIKASREITMEIMLPDGRIMNVLSDNVML